MEQTYTVAYAGISKIFQHLPIMQHLKRAVLAHYPPLVTVRYLTGLMVEQEQMGGILQTSQANGRVVMILP